MQIMTNNTIRLGEILSNPLRRRIIEILVDKGSKNITDLQYELGIRSYKNIHKHVKDLLQIGLIETLKAPHKEGIQLRASREKFFDVISELIRVDLKNMYPLVSFQEVDKYIKKREATEEELKNKLPEIKDAVKWYLLLFGEDYNLKIFKNGKKVESKNKEQP